MDISVIIPTYNSENFIKNTIESVLRQTHSPAKLIVVDDGSEDNTCSIARSYPEVTLLRNPNDGPNEARNHGARETDAQALAFLDHDDLWHPKHLQILNALLENHPTCAAAFSGVSTFSGSESPQYVLGDASADPHNPWPHYPRNTLGGPFCAVIPRTTFEEVGGWSPQFDGCADYHMWLKLSLVGKLVKSGCTTVGCRHHEAAYNKQLRAANAVNYYQRHISASKDALIRRRKRGKPSLDYHDRLEAHRTLFQIFKSIKQSGINGMEEASRRFDESLSETPPLGIISVWKSFRYYTLYYFKEIGKENFAEVTLDLLEHWSPHANRTEEVLREWAVSNSLRALLKYYPLNIYYWWLYFENFLSIPYPKLFYSNHFNLPS